MAGFCDRVLEELIHLTKKERQALRRELEGHIADHAEALEAEGLTPGEALARAEEAMGDPKETAEELAKCYSLFWLWLGRGVNLLLAVAVGLFLYSGGVSWLLATGSNLLVRVDPEIFSDMEPPAEGWTSQALDLRMEVGEQVVCVYRLDIDPEQGEAHVYCCHYPKNPFTFFQGSAVMFYLKLSDQRGRESDERGGISFMPGYRVWNYWEGILHIEPGDSVIYYTYDTGSFCAQMEIPLEVTP